MWTLWQLKGRRCSWLAGVMVVLCSAGALAATPFYEQFAKAEQAFSQGRVQQALKEYLFFVKNFHPYYLDPPYLAASRPSSSAFDEVLSLERRHSLHHAYMRLVQIDSRPDNKSHWLQQALAMALRAPHADLKPDVRLFPPPIVEQYYITKKSFKLKAGAAEQWAAPSGVAPSGSAPLRLVQQKAKNYKHKAKRVKANKYSQNIRQPSRAQNFRFSSEVKNINFNSQKNADAKAKRATLLKRVGVAVLVGVVGVYSYRYIKKGRRTVPRRSYQEGF